jgi:hypothetical protein
MSKRIVAAVMAVALLGAMPATVAQAGADKGKVPAVCVVKKIGKLRVQIGYCP